MLLEELQQTIILSEEDDIKLYATQINESSIKIGLVQSAGGLVKKSFQGIGKFAKNHPFITGAMAGYAVDAIKKYKKNKRNTITFYTKDHQEKKLYKDMMTQLMKSGKYRVEKDTVVDGGYLLVLKRL
jgi:hypothetical protein